MADGTVVCWGSNYDNSRNNVGKANSPDLKFDSVSAVGDQTCGLTREGLAACWGDNDDGQARAPGGEFLNVDAGDSHSCGVKADGYVSCWGEDYSGQTSPR